MQQIKTNFFFFVFISVLLLLLFTASDTNVSIHLLSESATGELELEELPTTA